MKILIISDIHGNLSALDSVVSTAVKKYNVTSVIILGDLIDYGMRSNEVVEYLSSLELNVMCAVWGNHEDAIMNNNFSRFSSQRGAECAKYTSTKLNNKTIDYINSIEAKSGMCEFYIDDKKALAVHGSLQDPLWGSITCESDFDGYEQYDYVFSGHNHCSHAFSVFFSSDNKKFRNKKRTIFINPGSVGQPRNHDPRAQFAILDTSGDVFLCGVDYDISFEQSLYNENLDPFYKDRIEIGV